MASDLSVTYKNANFYQFLTKLQPVLFPVLPTSNCDNHLRSDKVFLIVIFLLLTTNNPVRSLDKKLRSQNRGNNASLVVLAQLGKFQVSAIQTSSSDQIYCFINCCMGKIIKLCIFLLLKSTKIIQRKICFLGKSNFTIDDVNI